MIACWCLRIYNYIMELECSFPGCCWDVFLPLPVFVAFPLSLKTAVISIHDFSPSIYTILCSGYCEPSQPNRTNHCCYLPPAFTMTHWQLLYSSFALCMAMYSLNESINCFICMYVRKSPICLLTRWADDLKKYICFSLDDKYLKSHQNYYKAS